MIALLVLGGCAWLTEDELAHLRDGDDDGIPVWLDCDDTLPGVGAPGPRFADEDDDGLGGAMTTGCPDDGVAAGDDCDDTDASVGGERAWYPDADADGAFSGAASVTACEGPSGSSDLAGDDCDDTDAAVSPDAREDCVNGADDDCDGASDECNVRDAGLVLRDEGASSGLGDFASAFLPSGGGDLLVTGRPYASAVEAFAGLPRTGVLSVEDADWALNDVPQLVGNSLAVGDFNADGIWDLVAGAALAEDRGDDDAQLTFAYGGLYAGHTDATDRVRGETGAGGFATTMGAGDVDYDGRHDLVVGAPAEDDGCGYAYLLFTCEDDACAAHERVADYVAPTGRGVRFTAPCEPGEGGLGSAVLAVQPELSETAALVAVSDLARGAAAGAVYVWAYDAASAGTVDLGAAAANLQVWRGEEYGGWAGASLASGELDSSPDHDRADLVIGAPYANFGAGVVYILHDVAGRDGGTLDGATALVHGEPSEDGASQPAFGAAVAVVPDIDGDGSDELAVGAPMWSGSTRGASTGAVYLFYGPIDDGDERYAADADVKLYGSYPAERTGWHLDAGDVDADGRGDLAIGIPGWKESAGGDPLGAVVLLNGLDW